MNLSKTQENVMKTMVMKTGNTKEKFANLQACIILFNKEISEDDVIPLTKLLGMNLSDGNKIREGLRIAKAIKKAQALKKEYDAAD